MAEHGPIEVLVGLPRSLDGGEGPAAATARERAGRLAAAVGVPVRLVDERLTTVTAARRLRAGGRTAKQQRAVIDAAAAAAILEQALAFERAQGHAAGGVSIGSWRRLNPVGPSPRRPTSVSSMLDPEVKPSPAREIVHKGKGCLAVIVAAAVLVFGGYFVWDKATGFVADLRRGAGLPGAGQGQGHRRRARPGPRWT